MVLVWEHQSVLFFLPVCAIFLALAFFGASIFSYVSMIGTMRCLENILAYTLDIKILIEKK